MDNLPAGPELDRLIAEKVMGWEKDSSAFSPRAHQVIKLMKRLGAKELFWWKTGPGGLDFRIEWAPSTNIAHAWEVVGAIEARSQSSEDLSCLYLNRYDSEGWCATFALYGREDNGDWSGAPTAPLAICRAALAAVGHE